MTWTPRSIAELGRVVTGKTPDTNNAEYFGGDFPFVTPSDIGYSNYYCQHTERFVSETARERHQNQFLPKDSVMFTCIGNTIGKCAIASTDSLTNQQINSVIANEHHDAKFIYYCLTNSVQAIRVLGGGAATPIINKTAFENISVNVPTLDIQQKIGAILSGYDDLIENNRRRIALLEESARLLYREWFVRLRFPGYERTSIVNGVPQGWERKTLEEVTYINQHNIANTYNGEIQYIDIASVTPNSVNETTTYEFRDAPGRARRVVRHGDIIWSCVRPNRRSHSVIWQPAENLIASTGFVVISPKSLPTSFLYQAVTTDLFVGYLENHAKGAAYPAVVSGDFERATILVPTSALTSAFNDFAEPLLYQTQNLRLQNQKTRTARDLLLPRLMSGELAV